MKLEEIAARLDCRMEGPPELEISGVAGIEYAGAGHLTFLANRKYFHLLGTTRASAILIEDGIAIERGAGSRPLAALRTPNPYLAFAGALELFYQPPGYAPGVHPSAVVAKTAQIGGGAHIGPYFFVDDDVAIGENAVLHSFVTRSEEHTSELQSRPHLVCRLLLEKKKKKRT